MAEAPENHGGYGRSRSGGSRRLSTGSKAVSTAFSSGSSGHRAHEKEAEALRKDRARLASDLDVAKASEKELQRLADEASEALGAAISEVREALGKV